MYLCLSESSGCCTYIRSLCVNVWSAEVPRPSLLCGGKEVVSTKEPPKRHDCVTNGLIAGGAEESAEFGIAQRTTAVHVYLQVYIQVLLAVKTLHEIFGSGKLVGSAITFCTRCVHSWFPCFVPVLWVRVAAASVEAKTRPSAPTGWRRELYGGGAFLEKSFQKTYARIGLASSR